MTKKRSIAMAELVWVIIVVIVIMVVATGYFTQALDRAAQTRARVSASSLEKTASVVRAVWRLRARPALTVDFGGWRYQVNVDGWPLDAHPLTADAHTGNNRCDRLWQALISAPESATVKERKGPESRAMGPQGRRCRYRWPDNASGEVEYRPEEGKAHAVPE